MKTLISLLFLISMTAIGADQDLGDKLLDSLLPASVATTNALIATPGPINDPIHVPDIMPPKLKFITASNQRMWPAEFKIEITHLTGTNDSVFVYFEITATNMLKDLRSIELYAGVRPKADFGSQAPFLGQNAVLSVPILDSSLFGDSEVTQISRSLVIPRLLAQQSFLILDCASPQTAPHMVHRASHSYHYIDLNTFIPAKPSPDQEIQHDHKANTNVVIEVNI